MRNLSVELSYFNTVCQEQNIGVYSVICNTEERESQGLSFLLVKNRYYPTSIISPSIHICLSGFHPNWYANSLEAKNSLNLLSVYCFVCGDGHQKINFHLIMVLIIRKALPKCVPDPCENPPGFYLTYF
jgi:hypothetical protein